MTPSSEPTGIASSLTDSPMRPISIRERIPAIDVLRGLAVFGILTVNIYFFSHAWFFDYERFLEVIGNVAPPSVADRITYAVVMFLFQECLYSLFAFLFAAGAAMMLARAQAAGASFTRLYVRRILALFAIGLCHVVFFWSGDILITYAVVGFALLAFYKRADSTLLAWAAVCLSVGAIGFAVVVALTADASGLPAPARASAPATASASTSSPASSPASQAGLSPEQRIELAYRKFARRMADTYAHGTYLQVLTLRVLDYLLWTLAIVPLQYPRVLGMFLLGLWAGRRGIFQNVEGHLAFVRRVTWWGLFLSIAGGALGAIGRWQAHSMSASLTWFGLAAFVGDTIRTPAMAFAMAGGALLLLRREAWRRRLQPLAAVGRMSLSNYLLQSAVCSWVFYGYGLGLYGQVGPAVGLALAVAIFAVQVPLSVAWLRFFRFGPVEWLWRTLTYGTPPPMRAGA